jgi:hypothetical protein
MSARLRLAAVVMLSILSLGTPPAVAEDKRTPPPDLSGLAGPRPRPSTLAPTPSSGATRRYCSNN